MKFKSLLSEGFFGDLLDKGFERLQGYLSEKDCLSIASKYDV